MRIGRGWASDTPYAERSDCPAWRPFSRTCQEATFKAGLTLLWRALLCLVIGHDIASFGWIECDDDSDKCRSEDYLRLCFRCNRGWHRRDDIVVKEN